jgi:hypothetical protein
MAAFKDLSAKDRPEREGNSNNCRDIQFALHPVQMIQVSHLKFQEVDS